MIRRFLLPLLLIAGSVHAQPLRIATYNVLQFGVSEEGDRVAALKMVADSLHPDILCVQEIEGPDGFFAFSQSVIKPLGLSQGGFIDRDAIYFNSARLEYIDVRTIATLPYETHIYTLHLRGTDDTIDVVNAQLRSGSGNRDERSAACAAIRTDLSRLSPMRHSIVLGDLGMGSSQESGYVALTLATAPGSSSDPLNRSGNWSANTNDADLHTSSTRATALTDGGAGGGMVDRFDMILLSPSLLPRYVAGSYRALGQDGAHFARALTDGANSVVSPQLAQALTAASDHLPVVLELEFNQSGVEEWKMGGGVMNLAEQRLRSPNP